MIKWIRPNIFSSFRLQDDSSTMLWWMEFLWDSIRARFSHKEFRILLKNYFRMEGGTACNNTWTMRRPQLRWPWRKFYSCNAFSTKPCASNTFSKSQQSTKTEYRWSNLIGLLWCLQMTTMAFKKLAKNDSINQQHMDRRYSYPATPTYLSRVKPDLGLERCSIAELKVQRRYFHGQPHVVNMVLASTTDCFRWEVCCCHLDFAFWIFNLILAFG